MKAVPKKGQQEVQEQTVLAKSLAASQELAGKLKQKNAFTPAPTKPSPPTLGGGILGHKVLINGEWKGVGEEVAGAKILSVEIAGATIEWEGKEMKLSLPGAAAPAPKARPVKAKAAGEPEPVRRTERPGIPPEVRARMEEARLRGRRMRMPGAGGMMRPRGEGRGRGGRPNRR